MECQYCEHIPVSKIRVCKEDMSERQLFKTVYAKCNKNKMMRKCTSVKGTSPWRPVKWCDRFLAKEDLYREF